MTKCLGECADVDASERLGKHRLARPATAPRLSDDSAVRYGNVPCELCCLQAAPHRAVVSFKGDQRAPVKDQLRWCPRSRQRESLVPPEYVAASALHRGRSSKSRTRIGDRDDLRGLSKTSIRFFLKATQKPKKPVNNGQRVGRTARDVEVDRDVLGYAAVRGISAGERTTADRAGTHGNHELGRWHRSVGLSKR